MVSIQFRDGGYIRIQDGARLEMSGGGIGSLTIISRAPYVKPSLRWRLMGPLRWWAGLSTNDRLGYGLVWFFALAAVYMAIALPFVMHHRAIEAQAYYAQTHSMPAVSETR